MSTLSEYVMRRLDAGRSGPEICAELMAVGWSKDAADAAYREGLIALGIPLPDAAHASALASGEPAAPSVPSLQKAATMDIAVSVFSFILLAIVIGAFITLSFTLINRALPELQELQNNALPMATASAMHRSIASMAIAMPLYLFALSWWLKRFAGGLGRSESPLTKRLTYLVLLVAAVVIVCDLIAVVYSLLQGEMTMRFLLKVMVILGVAGIVFGFYLFERRAVQLGNAVPPGVFRGFGWGGDGDDPACRDGGLPVGRLADDGAQPGCRCRARERPCRPLCLPRPLRARDGAVARRAHAARARQLL